MKPIRSVEEFKQILKKAEQKHKKRKLSNVDLQILKECIDEGVLISTVGRSHNNEAGQSI